MTRNRPIPQLTDHETAYIRDLLVFEDEAIFAFNKPSGLPSQVRGNRARNLDHLLWAFARTNGKRPRLVHRLDVGTSGIILAARTKPDAAALSASLEGRMAEKTYLALIGGAAEMVDSGTCDAKIERVEEGGRSRMVAGHANGKAARTRWRVLARESGTALVELAPETGRMHQLRLHMAHLGCPILGDTLYGGEAASRLALHALSIALPHPRTSERVMLAAAAPYDFRVLARQYALETAVPETRTSR